MLYIRFLTLILVLTSPFLNENVMLAKSLDSKPQSFHYQINYDELYRFIGISKESYRAEWKKGKSITEIAKSNNIAQTELITFFGELQFEALNESLDKGEISKDFYYNYAISQMEDDIMQVINHNPNKQDQAKEIKYNHNSIKMGELINKLNFKVFIPEKLPNDNLTLEIKTYPDGGNDDFNKVRLHYMDKADQTLIVGIEQKMLSESHPGIPFQDAQTVHINGNQGYFKSFVNASGGILTWNQEGTNVEMDSNTLTKKEMIKMANSMRVAK